ncbi:deoxyribodipyrimidine photolyase [Alteribacter lacisalsi]|uniref:Deoxyribodipyrimidine photo-lyase n=1 Tax=Alteribacter lacisalsi TaxID=2045244 RepID=A0A2W0H4W8_9BACI|nr:deoxyribodipyrimidine photo-lyase [Alteribacter lacisalsi]PYZ96874.1 deoxyribodipyrimidine photolyase [Alteribacter lacisalsi]
MTKQNNKQKAPERFAVWFRSDFRLKDQAALYHAIETVKHKDGEWFAFFHLDPAFTDEIDTHHDYFFQTLNHFRDSCSGKGIHLHIVYGELTDTLERIRDHVSGWSTVYFNRDDAGRNSVRDQKAREWFDEHSIEYFDYEDAHIHAPEEIKKQDGSHYKVFTPYSKAWGKKHKPDMYNIDEDALAEYQADLQPIHKQSETFFEEDLLDRCSMNWQALGACHAKDRLETFMDERLAYYKDERDIPERAGTSRLSPYLKTGVLSPRQVFHSAAARREDAGSGAETYINELAWRDFYYMIHYFYPDSKQKEITDKYQSLDWNDSDERFQMWIEGRTGYPIVDAGMRQLNETGWMHNRLRMITASFLTKDFHIAWRKGEEYFQKKLIDYDQSSNIGGWQWAASVGTDAVPYFRVFNPTTQGKRFDPDGTFIRKYVPELKNVPAKYIHEPSKMPEGTQEESGCIIGRNYPEPAVDHSTQRKKAIAMFKGDD